MPSALLCSFGAIDKFKDWFSLTRNQKMGLREERDEQSGSSMLTNG